MMSFSFIYPHVLWLVLLLVFVWLLPRWTTATPVARTATTTTTTSHIASLSSSLLLPKRISMLLRTLMLLALILSLAGTQVVFPVDTITTIFLLDGSDSMSPSAQRRAEKFINDSLKTMRPTDQAGIIVFGEHPLVERIPDTRQTFGRVTSLPDSSHTDIEQAIQLGLALFPAETQKRLVLLSDGGENSGSARQAAHIAAMRHIPIDVVPFNDVSAMSHEALISHIEAPSFAHKGQTMTLSIHTESDIAQPAQLQLFTDEEMIIDVSVDLSAGSNQFDYTLPVDEQGFHRFHAHIEPIHDGRIQNNEAAVMVDVDGSPRILVVSSTTEDSDNIVAALSATGMHAETMVPAAMPATLAELSAYDTIVLANVPANLIPEQTMTLFPAYVRDLGKGLLMLGGTESYGVGGYSHTPVEQALPVTMDVRNTTNRPDVALVFLIDISGSMDACHCSGDGTTGSLDETADRKIDIAKEAAIQASSLLTPRDTLSIVAFHREAIQVYPTTTDPDPIGVADSLAPLEPSGSTNIGAGLLKAEEVVKASDAAIKHIILLTDGWGSGGSHIEKAERLNNEGITLSVIAAGTGSADYLDELAIVGGGRYYPVEDMRHVPQVLLNETITASGHYIIEDVFVPQPVLDSTLLHNIGTIPPLFGYNGTTAKDTARTLLVATNDAPLLVEWHYGLGTSIAWTSDMKGKWAQSVVLWNEYPQFVAQLFEQLLPDKNAEHFAIDTRINGDTLTVVAQIPQASLNSNDDGHHTTVTARLLPANTNNDDAASLSATDIAMMQVAPGEYRATIPAPLPGTYLMQLIGTEQGQTQFHEMAGVVVPYSSEYRQHQANPAVLADVAQLTGGQHLTDPHKSFAHTLTAEYRAQEIGLPLLWFALVLLPFDVAVRRWRINATTAAWFAAMGQWFRAHLTRKPLLATASHPNIPTTSNTLNTADSHNEATELERLRTAKERAIRRARGEE